MTEHTFARPILPLMNARQVAEKLGCSEKNVYRMVDRGLITYSRIGSGAGRIAFDPADVDSYIRARKVPATRKPRKAAATA